MARGLVQATMGVVTLLTLAGAALGQATTAVTGATVWTGTGAAPLADAVILVRQGVVECVGTRTDCPYAGGVREVDATGRWIIPGLSDTHVHLHAWFDGDRRISPEAAARLGRIYLANGITSLMDVGGQVWVPPAEQAVLRGVERGGAPAPRMLFSAWIDRRAVDGSGVSAGALARSVLASNAAGVKIRNGLSMEEIAEVVREADAFGAPVYGHTYDEVDGDFVDYTAEAVAMGVDGVFHVLGIPPVSGESRPPRPDLPEEDWEGWWLAGADLWNHATAEDMDRLVRRMVAEGAWLQPTLVTEESVVRPDWVGESPGWQYSPLDFDGFTMGWPAFSADELQVYESAYRRMQHFVLRFHRAGGMIVAGTDGLPVPGFGLHDELRLLVAAGLSPEEALLTATRNAAAAWGREDEFGTIAPGRSADLLMVGGNPLADINRTRDIWRVMRAGVLHDPAELLR